MTVKLLPRVVYQMCVHGALMAGSQARKMAGEDVEPNDYDLLVPLEKWQTIAMLIPEHAKPNKFGGWRFFTAGPADWACTTFTTGGHTITLNPPKNVEVDVWPDSVFNYLSNCKASNGEKVCVVDFINNKVYSQERLPL